MRQSSLNTLKTSAPETETAHVPSDASLPEWEMPLASPPSTEPTERQDGLESDPQLSPLQRGPLGTVYQYPAAYQTSDGKRLNAGERQALLGGFFVMLGLVIAIAVGWWIIPPAPSSLANSEAPRPQARSLSATDKEKFASGSSGAMGADASASTSGSEAEETDSPSRFASGTISRGDSAEASVPAATETASGISGASRPSSSGSSESGTESAPSVREEETMRLKARAYSETQKDRLSKTPSSRSEASPRPSASKRSPRSASTNLSQAVAECSNEVGLFFRERCKWRLCNGRWGKDGCPSYRHDVISSARVG